MRAAAAAAILCVLVTSGLARAQVPDDAAYKKAQEYFQAGKRAFDDEQYEVAIAAFEGAYKLTPKPAAAYALAVAYRNQWDKDTDAAKLKRAVTLFRDVLAQPDDAKKPKWPKTREYLDVLEPVLAELEAKQAAEGGGPVADVQLSAKTVLILSSKIKGTKFRFDDEKEPRTPPTVVETTPGRHRIAAYANGYYTTTQEVTAIEGESLPIDLVLDERPAAITVRSESGARVVIDGVVVGRTNQELSVPAGVHRVAVISSGRHVWLQQLQLTRGESIEIEASLRTTPKRAAVKWVAAAGGALLVTAGVAAGLALAAQREAEEIEDDRDEGLPLTPQDILDHNDAIDRRDGWRTGAAWLFGGAAAAALGVVYLLITDEAPAVLEPAAVALVPGGATASYAWAF